MTVERRTPNQNLSPPSLPSTPAPVNGRAALPIADQHHAAIALGGALPIAARPAPTTIACLQCQLFGKRRMTCSKADSCAELPQSFAVGPILLLAWFVTAVAFLVAVA